MDLEAVRIFVKVAELASFTRAAEQLAMPKARASARVAALERELGVRLLQRTTRTVAPTADGAQLLVRGRSLVAEADEVAAMFQGSRALRGTVRIDLPMGLARDVVIPKLPEFLAAHPLIDVQLSTTDRRVDVVREGFDCVVSVGALAASGLHAQRLGELAIANAASPPYVNRRGMPATVTDLAQHLLVGYAQRFGGGPQTFEYRAPNGRYVQVPMACAITVSSSDAYRAACLAGLGIIQAPRIGLDAEFAAGALVEVLPDLRSEPMPVSLVHPHGKTVPKRVRAVMGWLASVLRARFAAIA